MNIKTLLLSASASAVVFGTLAIPAFAEPGIDPNPTQGSDSLNGLLNESLPEYAVPGYDSARDNTICADHGAFGYYAHGGIPTLYPDTPRGADGYQTGINNGTLCGNRQGNL